MWDGKMCAIIISTLGLFNWELGIQTHRQTEKIKKNNK